MAMEKKRRKIIDIIHYHLNPGGVTKIIQSQVESLLRQDTPYDIRILCGECPDAEYYREKGVEVIVDDIFKYANFDEKRPEIINRLQKETEAASQEYLRKDSIIHFHNLNLAKNPYWTLAVHKAVRDGFPVINHAHDFSEDRPENQQFMERIINKHFGYDMPQVMYPDLPNYHMGVLNLSDYDRVISKGFKTSRLHYLPNPVSMENTLPPADLKTRGKIFQKLGLDNGKKLITYPVRVIRRKNIGEYILLSHFFQSKANFVVTLPPENPVEIEEYNKWKKFCNELAIPIRFEAGTVVDFTELITSSDFCVTTSIREGFGMAYIEPWMMSTPVTGRKLDNIMRDLTHEGLKFPSLYEQLLVPYNDGWKDMAEIDFESQRSIIRRIIDDKELSRITFVKNSQLSKLFEPVENKLIQQNQTIIKQKFSIASYGKRLEKAYQKLIG